MFPALSLVPPTPHIFFFILASVFHDRDFPNPGLLLHIWVEAPKSQMNTLQAQVGPSAWHLSCRVIWQRQPFCWESPNASICGSFCLGWSVPLEKAALSSMRSINLTASALEASWNKGVVSLLPRQLHLMALNPESLWSVLRRIYLLPSVEVREAIIWLLRSEEGIWESNCSLCGSSTHPVFSPSLPFHLQM